MADNLCVCRVRLSVFEEQILIWKLCKVLIIDGRAHIRLGYPFLIRNFCLLRSDRRWELICKLKTIHEARV